MVTLNKIYTRGGDGGDSSLVDGSRLKKSDLRFAAIGDVDEANAAIGFAIAGLSTTSPARTLLQRIQNDLFDLGADLATPGDVEGSLRITAPATKRLETAIDAATADLGELTSFVLPGGSDGAARLHLARTTARRAERTVVALAEAQPLNPEVLKYLNRLSDLLFQLARAENDGGATDVLWIPAL